MQVECRLPEDCGSTSSAVRSLADCSEHTNELARESQKVQTATRGTDNQKMQKTVRVATIAAHCHEQPEGAKECRSFKASRDVTPDYCHTQTVQKTEEAQQVPVS